MGAMTLPPHTPPLHTITVPVPDPTALTTEALQRETGNLAALFDARMDVIRARVNELELQLERRFQQGERNISAALAATNKALATAAVVDEKRFVVVEKNADRVTLLADKVESASSTLTGLRALMDARFQATELLVQSQADKVALALTASDKAVTKAEISTEKRFEAHDQFRAEVAERTKHFVPRAEFDAQRGGLTEKVDTLQVTVSHLMPRQEAEARWSLMTKQLEDRFSSMTKTVDELRLAGASQVGRGVGLNAGWVYLLGALAALGTVVTITLALNR